jgi:hypothetical protein
MDEKLTVVPAQIGFADSKIATVGITGGLTVIV